MIGTARETNLCCLPLYQEFQTTRTYIMLNYALIQANDYIKMSSLILHHGRREYPLRIKQSTYLRNKHKMVHNKYGKSNN